MKVGGDTEVGTDDDKHTRDSKENDRSDEVVIEKDYTKAILIYGVNESPPIHITLVSALQQGLMSISTQLMVSLMVAEVVCAADNDMFKARLLSSTLLMSGVTTVAMALIGVRLPIFQGATALYVIPLMKIASLGGTFCSPSNQGQPSTSLNSNNSFKMDANMSLIDGELTDESMERILYNVRSLQGTLMLAGAVHALVGFTGLFSVILRYIGPLTIVPTLILLFISFVNPVLKFAESSWPISLSTVALTVILFLYLSRYNMPVPVWTPSGGCRVIRYPLHQVFAVLIAVLVNWLLCAILTFAGAFTTDPADIHYNSRTDARIGVVSNTPWLSFPYPGQYGSIGFSGAAFVCFLCATVVSILDSVGDYYACARVCRVPPPPFHAVNRGLLTEGLCTFLSGAVGCGHATSSYGTNIGSIGLTKIASREVFVYTGILYILFGIFGKISAVFITIPYPVLGGAITVQIGIFFGVVLSNLEVTSLSSPRNIAVLGLSIFIGLIVPTWVEKVKTPIHTGNEQVDQFIAVMLGNPNLVGTVLACVLDNTVPGTREERGIAAWEADEDEDDAKLDKEVYNEGYEVYNPLLPERVQRWRIMKYVPFLPYRKH